MTMHYSEKELELMRMQAYAQIQQRYDTEFARSVPDIVASEEAERERIWQLVVDASRNG